MTKIVTLISLAFGIAASSCGQPRPIPLGTDTSDYGYISSGSKFGVSVGDDNVTARDALAREGFESSGTIACQESSLKGELGCQAGELYEIYHRHSGMGHGRIFVELENDHVSKIGWSFQAVQIDS